MPQWLYVKKKKGVTEDIAYTIECHLLGSVAVTGPVLNLW